MTLPDDQPVPEAATIENLLREERTFAPPPAFTAAATAGDAQIYDDAASDEGFEAFWTAEAARLDWMEPWHTFLNWNMPFAEFFVGGKLNVSVNCLDRHVANGLGNKVAYFWEGEPGDQRTLTYAELLAETCRMANALRELGVRKGDRVAIYMPMIPELPVAMLACARIGAPHSVVFGGFSADALAGRLDDAQCVAVITADGGYRKGATVPLKDNADDAIEPFAIGQALHRRASGPAQDVGWKEGRDHWYHDIVARQPHTAEPEPMDSEDLLYLLYTSGTTAKPKGIMHTTAGYLVGTATTHRYIFDIKPNDVYWCMADIGWVTGHSYIVYGPLANATTGVIYEGAIDFPDKDRWAQIAARHEVTILYTAPTAIRALMKYGREPPSSTTTSRTCGCWAAWASRSTPRPGPGTGSTSAAAAARWSTPGGRPRPG